jgi:hypothetical protein
MEKIYLVSQACPHQFLAAGPLFFWCDNLIIGLNVTRSLWLAVFEHQP